MLKRGWISDNPFYKVLAMLDAIKRAEFESKVDKALKLALVAILVETVANISFGPELYVSGKKQDVDVLGAFKSKVDKMVCGLRAVRELSEIGRSQVMEGDARQCDLVLSQAGIDSVDFVITSPPYPTEKDYTRQTRLELVFLGYVYDTKSLRRIKKAMVRSHSKGIYKADNDGQFVSSVPQIKSIADELRVKVAEKTYGFAKLYPRIIEEYFGGMYRHLQSLSRILQSGGRCAYVVGDQRTYGGNSDAFVAQLNAEGSDLVYASYLGGSGGDWATDVAVDGDRQAYVVGITESADFPTLNPFDASYGDYGDGFVVKLGAGSQSVTGVIYPSGGSLSSAGGEATFVFPNGAFTEPVFVTCTPLAQVEGTGAMAEVGRNFELTAVYSDTGQVAQLAPGARYTVTLTYVDSGPAIEDTLGLYSWDGTQWVEEPSSQLDTANDTIVATPDHMSTWTILGETNHVYLPVVVRGG